MPETGPQETRETALAAVQQRAGTPETPAEADVEWTATPHRDAWLVTRSTRRRGSPISQFRRGEVLPLHPAHTSMEEAYDLLRSRQGG